MDINHIKQVKQSAKILFSAEDIAKALDQLAMQINQNHPDTKPLVLCVVNGGIATMGHLISRITVPLEIDYIHASRYQGNTVGANIKWIAKPQTCIKNRNIIIVDDILDGGITLQAIIEYCNMAGAESVETAILLDKVKSRSPGGTAKATYTGLELHTNDFVFGFGMDYHNFLRNTDAIYAVSKEFA